ncbi:hypothetical protein GCM10022226_33020 [Sphaerisporangium flaviroseum]|uniref:Uncharacterized protein n=1 Tax=Sphaerisporangium flaviroseum TaxID=509199 RepID=A0ABP7I507_9ACTN
MRIFDCLRDRGEVTYVTGHHVEVFAGRDGRWVPAQGGHVMSTLEGLLDEDATGTTRGAKDGKTHDVAFLRGGIPTLIRDTRPA